MNRHCLVLLALFVAIFTSCDSSDAPAPAASVRFDQLGVSFYYPANWDLLQSEASLMGPTVIFNADGGNDDTDDLVLLMFVQLRENERGINNTLLEKVYRGHESLLDAAMVENYSSAVVSGRVANKQTAQLEPTGAPGGFVIKQTCDVYSGPLNASSVERRFELEDCAPGRVLLMSQQSTAKGRVALRAGLKEIRETLSLAEGK